ncbi:MAG: hypothetical protein V5A85_12010 [Haloarculaceae archaeon]
MSTTTPTTTTETGTTTETETDDRSRPGTTGTGRPDRWATSERRESTGPSAAAPRVFDPFCTRRLRNCVDAENAAFPDAD